MKNLIVIRGVSGSGKSTEAKRIVAEAINTGIKTMICSADNYFMQGGEYKFDATKLGEAHGQCKQYARQAMLDGIDLVVIDNTNTRLKEYQVYLDMAQEYGYEVEERVIGKFDEDAIKLYAERNEHKVPLASVKKMAERFEYTCELCGKTDKGVDECIDPYAKDMCGKEIEMYLCSECYTTRVEDI